MVRYKGVIKMTIYDLKILIVDDEAALRLLLYDIVTAAGFREVRTAADCAQAKEQFDRFAPDAVLLDVMLSDGDGFTLLETWRKERDVPILFISARDADDDRLHGLGLGADDYITKPFLPQEVVLRLTSVLRRAYRDQPLRGQEQLRLGDTLVDWGTASVSRCGQTTALTAKEFALLRKLSDNRGQIVTIDALSRAVWGDENFGYENTLMVYIHRLREKIEADPAHPRYLLTARGLGYKLLREDQL